MRGRGGAWGPVHTPLHRHIVLSSKTLLHTTPASRPTFFLDASLRRVPVQGFMPLAAPLRLHNIAVYYRAARPSPGLRWPAMSGWGECVTFGAKVK